MHFSTFICSALMAAGAIATPAPIEKKAVDSTLFAQFTRCAQFSHAAYQSRCTRPGGLEKLYTIRDSRSDIDGYIVKDDSAKQVIVAFRGTGGIADAIIDLRNTLVPWTSPGSEGCSGCTVHQGFQQQWNSVASTVITQVRNILAQNQGYSILVTGHSLGGSLTVMGGISLEKAFPGLVTGIGFASPRVGNPAFAAYVNEAFGDRMYRVTHTDDNVPQDLTEQEGYKHVATEYWISHDPASASNVVKCNGGEDPSCNLSVAEANQGLAGINAAHMTYIVDMSSSGASVCR